MKQFRQGDVLIEAVQAVETSTFKKQKERIILAHGEATGHAHTIEHFKPVKRLDNPDGSFFLSIGAPVDVTHQEHATITLPPGNYRVSRQREYTPEAVRNVAD